MVMIDKNIFFYINNTIILRNSYFYLMQKNIDFYLNIDIMLYGNWGIAKW